jgi:hypothetical protein
VGATEPAADDHDAGWVAAVLDEAERLIRDGRADEAVSLLTLLFPDGIHDLRGIRVAAVALWFDGDPAGALTMARRAIAKDPTDPWTFRLVAAASEAWGALADVAPAFDAALDLDPFDREVFLEAIWADVRMRRVDDRTVELARRAAEFFEHDAAVHDAIASVALAAEHPEVALVALRRAVAVAPGDAWARSRLATLLGRNGEDAAAAGHAMLVIAEHPDDVLAGRVLRLAAIGVLQRAAGIALSAAILGSLGLMMLILTTDDAGAQRVSTGLVLLGVLGLVAGGVWLLGRRLRARLRLGVRPMVRFVRRSARGATAAALLEAGGSPRRPPWPWRSWSVHRRWPTSPAR